jgi:hypothetical protein
VSEAKSRSGVKTDFQGYRGKGARCKFGKFLRLVDKVHKEEGKKGDYSRYFQGFEEYFSHFYLKAERAAVGFPNADMI